mgnify:FL=1
MSKIDNRIALDEIMLSQEKTQALVSQVKRLANDVTAHKTRGDIIADDIKAVAESLGITNSKLNELIKVYNGNLEGALGEMSSTVDILEVIKESINNG